MGGGGGGGLPGGFSSPVRSNFDDDRDDVTAPPDDRPRQPASNASVVSSSSRTRRAPASVVVFDPNAPFGDSDLTKLGSDDVDAGLATNQATPLATPEPGTLLLVGVAAALGSRAIRRRRRKNAQ
jgi:hypothetical protein